MTRAAAGEREPSEFPVPVTLWIWWCIVVGHAWRPMRGNTSGSRWKACLRCGQRRRRDTGSA